METNKIQVGSKVTLSGDFSSTGKDETGEILKIEGTQVRVRWDSGRKVTWTSLYSLEIR